jgi:hypothetical protein
MHFSSSLLSHASSLIKNGEPMALNITKEVANMERLSVGALCERYRKVFGEDTKARNKQWLTNHVRRKTSRNAPPQITRRQADRVGRRQGPPSPNALQSAACLGSLATSLLPSTTKNSIAKATSTTTPTSLRLDMSLVYA